MNKFEAALERFFSFAGIGLTVLLGIAVLSLPVIGALPVMLMTAVYLEHKRRWSKASSFFVTALATALQIYIAFAIWC